MMTADTGAGSRSHDANGTPGDGGAVLESERRFDDALSVAAEQLDRSGLPWALIGGVASAAYGRPRWTQDIDVFCRPQHASEILSALAEGGMTTEETNPKWIFKAFHDDVQIDIIFKTAGMYFDDEMERRVQRHTFREVEVPVAPREDLVVIKAVMHDEDTPRHWYDALGMLANAGSDEIDWEYLLFRARQGSRRVLSLLLYAQSCDLVVPSSVVDALYEQITGSAGLPLAPLEAGPPADVG
ncbi:MAG TPA: nucleotidyl transferase AbiEii/AbiGii toxin family protein [Ilumatobacteraceae bacterium]|nr:nucleotidyl transferase AbiEii/AbiGii toxin family protein [Ilumatobacteraceae bacterium]